MRQLFVLVALGLLVGGLGWLAVRVWQTVTYLASYLVWLVKMARAWATGGPLVRSRLALARRVRRSWPRLAVALNLCMVNRVGPQHIDLRTGRVSGPQIVYPPVRVSADEHGVIIDAATVPGIGVAEYAKAAPHLANAWGLMSVQVRGFGPGAVRLRGLLTDPLLDDYPFVPVAGHARLDALHLGRDEYGEEATISVVNVSGITIGGLPGFGKTSQMGHLICQLAPNPAVQFAVLDGKGGGDYDDIAPRCFLVCDDDIQAAGKGLKALYELMRSRQAAIKAVRGTANMWHDGPSTDWPLVVVVVDESHTFVQTSRKQFKAVAEENAWHLEQLAKKGRSVGLLLIMITQKQTGDAIPTSIRDVCQIGLTFACRTIDAAVAALGEDIRQYPDANPVKLLLPEYVGVMVARLPNQPGYTRIRGPWVPEDFIAKTAQASAALTADPSVLLADLTGRDDRPRLVTFG